ncbi:MAG: helix-turn-helix transcriptional regulator [Oscillospiraceae bacterium]|nr:helix-turn-helix transcriptional regulator [Oscillospiraceae bacterium]
MVKNLKTLRTKFRLSQQQLADVIGVSQQSVNKYENHNIEPDNSNPNRDCGLFPHDCRLSDRAHRDRCPLCRVAQRRRARAALSLPAVVTASTRQHLRSH